MKLLFILYCFTCILSACGSKYDSYQAACEAGDYDEAYRIAENINEEAEDYGRSHAEKAFSSAWWPEKRHYEELKYKYLEAKSYIEMHQRKASIQEFLKDNDYEIAADNNQFDVAYNILNKAKKEGHQDAMEGVYGKSFSQMYSDVLEKEIKYLLQENNSTANIQVLFLLKEQKIKEEITNRDWNKLCNVAKELALAIGNEDLAKKINDLLDN